MSDFKSSADRAFRDFKVQGVPASGDHEPIKSEIRGVFGEIQETVDVLEVASFYSGTAKVVSTKSQLASLPSPAVGDKAQVIADPAGDVTNGNGIYRWSGTAWVWIGPNVSQELQDRLADEATAAALLAVAPVVGAFTEGMPPADEPSLLVGVKDREGRLAPIMRSDGRHMQMVADGTFEVVPTRAEIGSLGGIVRVPLWGLIDGERPDIMVLDNDSHILEVYTVEGSYYVAGASGQLELVRRGSQGGGGGGGGGGYIPSYLGQTYDWGRYLTGHAPSADVCFILLHMGQSNATGVNPSSDTLPGATPIYPDSALQLNTPTPRFNGSIPVYTTTALKEVAANGERETAATAAASTLIRDIEASTGRRIRTLSAVPALGGRAYRGLNRGSAPYEAMLVAVRSMVEICRERGWVPICPGIDWMQGESDAGGPNMNDGRTSSLPANDYVRGMRQFARQVSADIRAITGQAEDVPVFISQIARSAPESVFGIWFGSARQAQRELHGEGNIRLVGPGYQFDFTSDGLHLTSAGQNGRGQRFAKALYREVLGAGWSPVIDTAHRWISNTVIDIEFEVPTLPLVLDESGTTIATTGIETSKGFHFDDGTGAPPAIASVALQNDRTVRITLAAAPAGVGSCRVGYALKRLNDTAADGRLTGGRGLLRDSNAHTSLFGLPAQANWAVAFIREVGRP